MKRALANFSNYTKYCLRERDGAQERQTKKKRRKRRWIDRKEVKAIRGGQYKNSKTVQNNKSQRLNCCDTEMRDTITDQTD